jgi:hypothetical protein
MMELLVRHGADVNAAWHGFYPVLFAPCETLDPVALDWLLQHGADPDCGEASDWQSKGRSHPGTALDFVLGTYVRDKDALNESIKLIRDAGGSSQYGEPGVIATIRGDSEEIELLLRKDHSVVERRYPSLNVGTTAGRMLTLKGATLSLPSLDSWKLRRYCSKRVQIPMHVLLPTRRAWEVRLRSFTPRHRITISEST